MIYRRRSHGHRLRRTARPSRACDADHQTRPARWAGIGVQIDHRRLERRLRSMAWWCCRWTREPRGARGCAASIDGRGPRLGDIRVAVDASRCAATKTCPTTRTPQQGDQIAVRTSDGLPTTYDRGDRAGEGGGASGREGPESGFTQRQRCTGDRALHVLAPKSSSLELVGLRRRARFWRRSATHGERGMWCKWT